MTNHVLKHEGRLLQHILDKVEALKQLNASFSQHLEPELAKHCCISKIDKDCLIVLVDNSHWATRLRFCIPELLPALQAQPLFQNIKAICSKVRPQYDPVKYAKKRQMMALSPETAQSIQHAAQNIKDEKLRKILEKIATRLRIP